MLKLSWQQKTVTPCNWPNTNNIRCKRQWWTHQKTNERNIRRRCSLTQCSKFTTVSGYYSYRLIANLSQLIFHHR